MGRAAAAGLQSSLLPARLPMVPGLELAACYVPAEDGEAGDWYDVFTLPSGCLCIVIGDVVGRGLEAPDVIGRLRSVLRAYALLGDNPAEVLGRVDRHVQHFELETTATVLLAMFEPSFERLHLSAAGHPPPVLAMPDQPAALLEVPSDHPLGDPRRSRRRATTITVPPGALLCFYTDGLVEHRDTPLDAGLNRLCDSVVAGPVESVCAEVMARLVGDDAPGDEVALLTVRRQYSGEIGSLDLVVPALPWLLKDIRMAMRRWLLAVGAAPHAVADLLVAVGEACTNAVEHAYGPDGGTVTVHLELQPPDVLATVRDAGRWRPRGDDHQGRGTQFMHNCSDELRIDHGPTGTNVLIRRRLVE
jgi:anti-sigma regulatory factor (Ser/Thr protein kinase)